MTLHNSDLTPLLDGDFWQRCTRNSFKLLPNFNTLPAAIFVYRRIFMNALLMRVLVEGQYSDIRNLNRKRKVHIRFEIGQSIYQFHLT